MPRIHHSQDFQPQKAVLKSERKIITATSAFGVKTASSGLFLSSQTERRQFSKSQYFGPQKTIYCIVLYMYGLTYSNDKNWVVGIGSNINGYKFNNWNNDSMVPMKLLKIEWIIQNQNCTGLMLTIRHITVSELRDELILWWWALLVGFSHLNIAVIHIPK